LPRDRETRFLASRVARMLELQRRAQRLLNNPLIKIFARGE
jgi:hypothetical protein